MQVKLSAVQLFSRRKKKPSLSFKVKTKKKYSKYVIYHLGRKIFREKYQQTGCIGLFVGTVQIVASDLKSIFS